ncbi:hypothetical protein G9C85_06940 [Halorubellus sp. JP-L1]|uniref:hypothetical protein n=1 Tax=Halorubellus sp. JP-L1 TaxID=2715753 RepID=UPI00140860A3|nr:hypothetical protein [Halorubellus sp. JP-L1]NHN41373.1 hypothetical protein [Halorubellus sp. JP-L1]
MTSRRERALWVVLFSLAPATGIAFATAKVSARTVFDPLVGVAFVGAAIGMFLLVFGATSVGSTNVPERGFE